jgi:hypothetical protein
MKLKIQKFKKEISKRMYKITIILPTLFLLSIANSCHKEIKAKKGGIDIISNVYFEASKGLSKMQNFHLSRMNYSGDTIIELVPDLNFPEITSKIFYIKDSLYYSIENENTSSIIISDIIKKQKPFPIEKKTEGALFSKEQIPNYKNRTNLSDTVLFKKNYKRFEVNSPWNYTRFYIYPTDTILPYSFYKHAEKDYGGRLERIDSYNKKKNIFVTLQLIPRKNWNSEAKEIFDFNAFLIKKK